MKDISVIISERCVNPNTGRPYTASMIEKAIESLHITIKFEQSAKQQALEVIKQLERNKTFPIARMQMRIKVLVPTALGFKVKDEIILENGVLTSTKILKEEWEEEDVIFELLVDPGKYKIISDKVAELSKGAGTVFAINTKE